MEIEKDLSSAIKGLNRQAVVVMPQQRPLIVRRPWIGIIVMLVGILLFSLLANQVLTKGPLIGLDQPLAQSLHNQARHGSWVILGIMWFFSATGMEGIMMFLLVLSVIWIWQRRWRELTLLIYGVGGGEMLYQTLGHIVNRHRPVFPDPLETLPGPGFPSGHTTTSIILFGLMLYLLWPRLHSWPARLLGLVLVPVVVGLIGFGRMYIGDHFLTDILAGVFAGTAWGAAVLTGVEVAYWSHQPGGRTGQEPTQT